MRAQSGYLASKGVKKEERNSLTGEDVGRFREWMDREERKNMVGK